MQTLNRYEIVDKVARKMIAELEANGIPTVEAEGKIPFPVDSEGNLDYGTAGYAIISNGDGSVRYEESVVGGLLQEKSVTENGEVVPDEGYDGLSKVTVNVPVTNSVSGGYMVNFFNTEGEVVQVHSAKYGYSIDKPLSYDVPWADINGQLYAFPLVIHADSGVDIINAYSMSGGSTMETVIYEHFGISKSSYEWVVVRVDIPNKTVAAYFVPAPTAPGNLYDNGSYSGHIFSGNMRSAAKVYTVSNTEVSTYPANNIKSLFNGDPVYSTMSTLNIPFTRDETVLLYANYTNEAINLNLTNSYMIVD